MVIMYGNKGSRMHALANKINIPITEQHKITPEMIPDSNDPIVMFSVCPQKMALIQECRRVGRPFYTFDTAYIGNMTGPFQKGGYRGFKKWYRLAPNGLQHTELPEYDSDDRLRRIGFKPVRFNRGKKILVPLPGPMACEYYSIDINNIEEKITAEIRQHTDREIVFRAKSSKGVRDRMLDNPFWKRLSEGDIHCIVTWGSVASLESVCCGIPSIALRECIASPVCSSSLSDIENPFMPNDRQTQRWLRSISKVCVTQREVLRQIKSLHETNWN